MTQVEIVSAQGCHLGESPLWCARSNMLFWIDCDPDPALYRLDPASGAIRAWPMPSRIGAVALHDGSNMLVALRDGVYRFDLESAALSLIAANPQGDAIDLHEGRCDRQGRLWIGAISRSGPGKAGFHRLGGARLDRQIGDISIANSLAFSPDGRTLYVGDTAQQRVWACDYDIATGTAGPRRIFLDIPPDQGQPDGAAVDSAGNYWLALFRGGCVRCHAPDGTLLRQIDLPVTQPTMVAFGGRDLRDLYITTTCWGKSDADLTDEPALGHLLRIRDAGQGLPETPWAGRS